MDLVGLNDPEERKRRILTAVVGKSQTLKPPLLCALRPVRHRQTKGAATDMFDLQPPRQISTLR
jgi:hypothetical protein